nr:DUF2383 domain-containing protein [Dyella sp. 2HG41-7]
MIRRSIELRALYRHAATQVGEPGLRTVLEEEAQSLSQVIAELQAQMRSHDNAPATRRRVIGAVRYQFDTLIPRNDDAWIRLLAHHEQILLRAFERSLSKLGPGDMTTALRRQLSRLHSIDLDMNSLSKAIGVGH